MADGRTFNDDLVAAIQQLGTERTFDKREMVLREGEVEKNVYYVVSGAVRVFLLSEHEELTIRFGYEGSIINSLSSFIKGTPSEFYIETIRKTTLRIIDREHFLRIAHSGTESLKQYTALLELLVTQQIEREIDLLTVSPSERLQRVLARSPHLFQQIPLKYIASYLRMTPETLSRVRNS
ncbi:Crp/Fnr family transcriptional regulator [Nemorincola caseinilytica]|uniref:Crp/Fnr family transcriptional regulator n=1 Tax=Nemorincola caseinilytica TaxID=2054315 RepID=A0ABP8NR33_9BACT